ELVAQTRMSRATVREALRILQVQGLVRIKAGRAGGTFVQRPGRDAVAKSVSLRIRGQQFRVAALLETREAIEPFCARLAARNRTDADLVRLEEANEDLADETSSLARFLQANVDWHLGVPAANVDRPRGGGGGEPQRAAGRPDDRPVPGHLHLHRERSLRRP